MAERLATWVWVGAAALASVAGIVNVVGFLGFQQQAVTHLTGNTSLLAAALVGGKPGLAIGLGAMLAAFVGGAMLSGLIVQDSTLRLGRRYGVVLTIESLMLLAAVPLFRQQHLAGPILAAMACGLQNAMATTYSGALVRTSHVSGMFTDLGIMLGHAVRGLPLSQRRLALCALVTCFFFLGGIAGAWLFGWLGYAALYLPAALTGGTGLGYFLYRQLTLRRPPGPPL
ncbi:membrane protein [Lysobacter arseniciresistens ZS79]|uniref:Membrane protein n=1 Tax=Lysobacter arseniciresistens ZS79 TaxID=913325 RepID=A0A0A0EUD6_9GAMM|nr:YoaK family protein [Lysobacter arseniciresistens]KGM53743.1 membrane protein [Lysobacter arseniciresistens ZS79]